MSTVNNNSASDDKLPNDRFAEYPDQIVDFDLY